MSDIPPTSAAPAEAYPQDYLVTAAEVARKFGVSDRTARNLVAHVRAAYDIFPRYRVTVAQFNAVHSAKNYRFAIAP